MTTGAARARFSVPPVLFRSRHYLVILGSLGLLSVSPIIVRFAQAEHVPSIFIAGARMLLAAILITPLVLRFHYREIQDLTPRALLLLALTGVWMSLNGILVIISLETISILTNQMLASTAPVWVALFEVTLLKTRLHSLIWMGILLVVCGSVIISFSRPGETVTPDALLGAGLALASAVCGAIYMTLGRKLRQQTSILPYLWVVYGCGGMFGLLVMAIMGVPFTGYSRAGYGWVAASTVLVQVLGFSGMNYALAFFPATIISIAGRSVAVTSAALAFLIFLEVPGPAQIVGSAVILAGVISAITGQERARRREAVT